MNAYQHLTHAERYMIYRLKKICLSIRKISRYLDRSVSTIYREIQRNSGGRGYRYKQTHEYAQYCLCTSHKSGTITKKTLELVKSYLRMEWSPEQISNYLKLKYSISISTKSIYQYILSNKSEGGFLYRHLRQSRKKNHKRYGSGNNNRGCLKNRISIDERPALEENRNRIGDWEIDTIIGKRHKGALVTIVERKSRYTLIAKVSKKESNQVGT